ncbi:MAG: 16S rRNA (cytosine(967)-C(5))-methyltransferase RsmB, partial [Methylotenera sp.]
IQTDTESNEVALYSYPQWWINKLKQQYPASWKSILATGNVHPPMTLRVNVQKTSAKEYVQLLARQDIVATQVGEYAVILEQPISVDKTPGFLDGVVSVQDYGAQLAAGLLDVHTGLSVLDACCAPGGKTGHILELSDVKLTALDNDASRLDRVKSNLNRLNLSADLQLGDAAKWQSNQPFERILADVPCTASGIVRRHVDIKWLRLERDILTFTQQQALILANLWQLLAKGGKLLYVTCSIFNEENQQQIDAFLLKNPDATQLPLILTNENHQNIQSEHGQLIPNSRHDGLFYALLQKTA